MKLRPRRWFDDRSARRLTQGRQKHATDAIPRDRYIDGQNLCQLRCRFVDAEVDLKAAGVVDEKYRPAEAVQSGLGHPPGVGLLAKGPVDGTTAFPPSATIRDGGLSWPVDGVGGLCDDERWPPSRAKSSANGTADTRSPRPVEDWPILLQRNAFNTLQYG